jgi:hypothetical protein
MKRVLPLELEEEIKKTFKIRCLENDTNMTTIIRKFVEAYSRNPEKVTKFINSSLVCKTETIGSQTT